MKKNTFLGLLALSILASSGCGRMLSTTNTVKVTIPGGLNAYKIEGNPSTLTTFKAEPASITLDNVVMQAQEFGIHGVARQEGDSIILNDGSKFYTVKAKTGLRFYEDRSAMWGANDAKPVKKGQTPIQPKPNAPTVPDESTAKQIAYDYILQHKLTDGETPVFYQTNEFCQSFIEANGISSQKTVMQKEIVFKRMIGGNIIHGSGSQVSIFIGDKGSITGAFVDWPHLIPDKKVTLKDGETALSGLQSRLEHLNNFAISGKTFKSFQVKKMKLGYIGYLNSDGSHTVVPTYAVLGMGDHGNHQQEELVTLTASDQTPVQDPKNEENIEPATNIPAPLATPAI